jgi:hypothetical protein
MNIDKVYMLNKMVGTSVSENFSPTLRAKLLLVLENPNECLMEVVKSQYESMTQGGSLNEEKVGTRYLAPIDRIWNAYFY